MSLRCSLPPRIAFVWGSPALLFRPVSTVLEGSVGQPSRQAELKPIGLPGGEEFETNHHGQHHWTWVEIVSNKEEDGTDPGSKPGRTKALALGKILPVQYGPSCGDLNCRLMHPNVRTATQYLSWCLNSGWLESIKKQNHTRSVAERL